MVDRRPPSRKDKDTASAPRIPASTHIAGDTMRVSAGRLPIDDMDLRLLDALQRWGRSSLLSLAKHTGLTSPPTLRRVRKLQERGIIRGYHATIDRSKLGYDLLCFVTVQLVSQSDRNLRAFESLVREWPNVRECLALSGHHDFLLKCAFRDARERDAFAADALGNTPNVERISVLSCVRVGKEEPGLPLRENRIADD
ncbi:MAG: Lrp/AsnC family transcriptional regulator [Rhizomicrobium sp.]